MQTRRLTTKNPPNKTPKSNKQIPQKIKQKKSQTETPETKLKGFRYHKGLPYLGKQNLRAHSHKIVLQNWKMHKLKGIFLCLAH